MSERQPLVSAIIPCYNHRAYVGAAIDSILGQTYRNVELIVIDDGSSDGSAALIEQLSGKHGFMFISQANRGLAATLNRGIEISRGKYLALLASDDLYLPDKLEILVARLEQMGPDYAVACGDADFIDETGAPLEMAVGSKRYTSFLDYHSLPYPVDFEREFGRFPDLVANNYIPAMSALLRREAVVEVGMFNESVALEDWDLWLRLSRKYRFAFSPRVLARYRVHGANSVTTMTSRLFDDALLLLEREKSYCQQHDYAEQWQFHYYRILYLCLEQQGLKALGSRIPWAEMPLFLWVNFKRVSRKWLR